MIERAAWSQIGFALATLLLASSGCHPRDREAAVDLRTTSCLGPAGATSFAVYLHGVDNTSVSEQEVANRANLAQLAGALSMRIALPRAPRPCQHDSSSLCWGWAFDKGEVDAAVNAIDDAAASCFGERPFGLIGFSNGGYLLNMLLRTCRLEEALPAASWMVAIGSAVLRGPLEPAPANLAGCGQLVLLTGTDDTYNSDPRDTLFRALRTKGANVASVRFDGGHIVPGAPLKNVLEQLRSPEAVPR